MAAVSSAASSAPFQAARPSEAAAAAGWDLPSPPSTEEEESPMSCTSGFFTKFWLGDVPEKEKKKGIVKSRR